MRNLWGASGQRNHRELIFSPNLLSAPPSHQHTSTSIPPSPTSTQLLPFPTAVTQHFYSISRIPVFFLSNSTRHAYFCVFVIVTLFVCGFRVLSPWLESLAGSWSRLCTNSLIGNQQRRGAMGNRGLTDSYLLVRHLCSI